MSLIDKICQAIQNNSLASEFTTKEFKNWIETHKIVKDDNTPYAESSINAILSNSDVKNKSTSNLNKKVLSSKNKEGNTVYFFNSNCNEKINAQDKDAPNKLLDRNKILGTYHLDTSILN